MSRAVQQGEARERPKRIQRKRVKGYRQPAGTIYVGRPTRYGNPFRVLVPETLPFILEHYESWLRARLEEEPDFLEPLRDAKYLSCFCPLSQSCHVETILKLLKELYG